MKDRPAQPYVALLRGINVGRAKRIAMADLRAMVERVGYTQVRTVLNSGNVIFSAPPDAARDAAADIEAALTAHGIAARVFVVAQDALRRTLAARPFPTDVATDPSRLLVAVFGDSAVPPRVQSLAGQDWEPDRMAIVGQAAFLWCATGILEGRLFKAFNRAAGDTATTRNWATMAKLAQEA